jgi:hypothetical protein
MNKIIMYIFSAFLTMLSLIGLFMFGRKQGVKEEQADNLKEITKVTDDAKKQSDKVDAMSNAVVRNRLRKFSKD